MKRACPRCSTALDEGPTVYRCSHCQRAVYAADLNTEFVARRLVPYWQAVEAAGASR